MITTRIQLLDILENHDIETEALQRQLDELSAELASDLDEIRNRVYPKATTYDRERVQAAPTPTDEKVTAMVMALDKREEQYHNDVAVIQLRLAEMRLVYNKIHELESIHKSTLLNLYYPVRTIEEVATMMKADRSTVRSRKNEAIEKLLKKLSKNAPAVHH